MKSSRNRTIDLSVIDGQDYLNRTIRLNTNVPLKTILNKTILGDTFETLKYIPKKSIDLLVVDPPYNLNKDFDGDKFKKRNDQSYFEYLELMVYFLFYHNS